MDKELKLVQEFVPSGHFYSVIPKIDKEYEHNKKPFFDYLDYNDESHETILSELGEYLKDYEFPVDGITEKTYSNDIIKKAAESSINNAKNNIFKYYQINGSFEWMDGRMLYYMIKKNSPKRIIEIGSGFSTLLMSNTIKKFKLDTELICIEPYPLPWLNKMDEQGLIKLTKTKLEDTDISLFKSLNENDILFIDSTHVCKLNSDVLFYMTKIFPILNKDVLIHIHDIFFPYDYHESWIKKGMFWNEQYFLYSFLMYNDSFKIVFGNNYASHKYSEKLKEIQKDSYELEIMIDIDRINPFSGGSFWIKKLK